jgi:prepilin-type N-terminal cleavage/methylation domain-containing protein
VRYIHQHRAAGFTLIEVLAAATLGSVILALVAASTTMLLRQRDAAGPLAPAWQSRLADQLRRDLRAGQAVRTGDEAGEPRAAFVVEPPDGPAIQYRREERGLLRVVLPNDEPRPPAPGQQARQTARQERFRLPKGSRLRWKHLPQTTGEVAELEIDYPLHERAESKRRQLTISVLLGRDLRWRAKP